MRRVVLLLTIAALSVLGLIAASVLPSGAQIPPAPIAVELLTPRSNFTDDVALKFRYKLDGTSRSHVINSKDPSRTVVARITVQPGAQFPWHSHPGPVIVNVAQGELVYVQAHDCVERSYPAEPPLSIRAGDTCTPHSIPRMRRRCWSRPSSRPPRAIPSPSRRVSPRATAKRPDAGGKGMKKLDLPPARCPRRSRLP